MADEPSEILKLVVQAGDLPRLTPEQAREARLMELLFEPEPWWPEEGMDDPDYGF